MKNKGQQSFNNITSFAINYKYENQPQYPFLLANTLIKTESQFQQSRAMKMLGDWVLQYEQLSQIIKFKYAPYISKVQKILISKFQQKFNMDYCMGKFLIYFHQTWKQITNAIVEGLLQSDSYYLQFIWYVCHHLVEQTNFAKQQSFLQYLNLNFQKPLRQYDPQTFQDALKILQIVYMINLHGCRLNFEKYAYLWAQKIQQFEESGITDIKLTAIILKNKSILTSNTQCEKYWLNKVQMFLQNLQKTVPKMTIDSAQDRLLLDIFMQLLQLKQVKAIILDNQNRYLCSLLGYMRSNQNNPKNIFNLQKYAIIKAILYQLFFQTNKEISQNKLYQIMHKFTNHSFSIFNEEYNYIFLDCISQGNISLEFSLVQDLIRIINNPHIRRTLSAKILIVLAKTLTALVPSSNFNDQMLSMCFKSYNQCLVFKVSDPLIGQLREKISKLFYQLMNKFNWQDNYKSDCIFGVVEQFQKNNKHTNSIILNILLMLIIKFNYSISNLHKVEALISQIHLKVSYDQSHIQPFISLMIAIYFSTKWQKSYVFIESICSKNPSKSSSFFLFQAQQLMKANSNSSQNQIEVITQMMDSVEKWNQIKIQANLMLLQMYFLRISSSQAFKMLSLIDQKLVNLFEIFYQQKKYHLLAMIASKTLPACGSIANLEKLQSFAWVKKYSFQILARSFYKTTSIYVCNIFSSIILRAENINQMVKWLCQQQFLDYLYQGLNDFLSKEKKYPLQIATNIMVFKLFKHDQSIIPSNSRLSDFTTLFKNVAWWDQAKNNIIFTSTKQRQQKQNSTLLPQFYKFYQLTLSKYFADYEVNYKKRKALISQQETIYQQPQYL